VGEPPARAGGGGVALQACAELALADGVDDLAFFVDHILGVLAVAVEQKAERVELAGEPAIEARAFAHVVVDRLVGAPDPAAMVDRDRFSVERREPPAAHVEFDVLGRRDLERVDIEAGAVATRVQLDQRLGQARRQLVGRRIDVVQPGRRVFERCEQSIQRIDIACALLRHAEF